MHYRKECKLLLKTRRKPQKVCTSAQEQVKRPVGSGLKVLNYAEMFAAG